MTSINEVSSLPKTKKPSGKFVIRKFQFLVRLYLISIYEDFIKNLM